jgi:hypothetical protein
MLNVNVVFVGILVLVLMILAMILVYAIHRSEQRIAVRKTLIEKYASAHDLNELMQTPAGRRLFAEFSAGGSPLRSVLASVQMGVLGILAGAGVWGIGAMLHDDAVFGVGGLLVCIGLGFLISAAITYRLSKSWGLLEKKD